MKLVHLGIAMFLAGLSSIVLQIIGYELRMLSWINIWGAGFGWLIRIGLVIGGALLFFKYQDDDDEPSTTYFN